VAFDGRHVDPEPVKLENHFLWPDESSDSLECIAMTRRIPSSCFAILIAPLFLTPAVGNPDAAAQQGANSIRNFRAASPSTAEPSCTAPPAPVPS